MKPIFSFAMAVLISVGAAHAADFATGDQITATITGNTVQGSMTASGSYTEYYSADGTVHGPGYKAKWSVEGDTMCWVYDGSPKECWNAALSDDQVSWIKDGKTEGDGTILPGNPNNF